jgi:hypothetical protein
MLESLTDVLRVLPRSVDAAAIAGNLRTLGVLKPPPAKTADAR